ncbi:MAG: hypothetical protein A2W17_08645 [Planctomycetes bacterium RBG_16_41_13]|nr:MAG: hypothetical protein A2W17_08645 [Planctomycetes bacterium RBG_16_41_13]
MACSSTFPAPTEIFFASIPLGEMHQFHYLKRSYLQIFEGKDNLSADSNTSLKIIVFPILLLPPHKIA